MAATASPTGDQRRNRRRWSRYPVGHTVRAELVSGETRTACLVEDVSLAGARLRFEAAVPDAILFQLNGPEGICVPGRRVWTGTGAMGVAFGLSGPSVALALALIRQQAARGPAAGEEEAAS